MSLFAGVSITAFERFIQWWIFDFGWLYVYCCSASPSNIPEWLAVMNQDDEDRDLYVAINDLSLNNEFKNDSINLVINQMNDETRVHHNVDLI